jgi:pimeloyl-ACP methyl ester carboxylesterase
MDAMKTSEDVDHQRRRFFGSAAMTIAAAQCGMIGSANAQTKPPALPAIKPRAHTSFGSLKHVNAGVLSIAYAEAGPADGPPVLLFHGWPYDIHSFVDVAPILANAGYRVLIPYLRGYGETRFLSSDTPRNAQPAAVATDAINFLDALKIQKVLVAGFDWGSRTANLMAFLWPERCKGLVAVSGYVVGSQAAWANPLPPSAEFPWWYAFYFATERGGAGYAKYTKDFNRLIWQLASPRWAFDEATFERTAKAFENPDFVHISLHNYRWYMRLEQGESKYDELEARIATFPTISLPTITLEGDANGAPHGEPSVYARKYTGKYEHRNIAGGIGHNLPQEAPEAFAQAVVDVGGFAG